MNAVARALSAFLCVFFLMSEECVAVRDYVSRDTQEKLDTCRSRLLAAAEQGWKAERTRHSRYAILEWTEHSPYSAYRRHNAVSVPGHTRPIDGKYVLVTDFYGAELAWGRVEKTVWSPEDQHPVTEENSKEQRDPRWIEGVVLRTPQGDRRWVRLDSWRFDAIASMTEMRKLLVWEREGVPANPPELPGNCSSREKCADLEDTDEYGGYDLTKTYRNESEVALSVVRATGPGGFTFDGAQMSPRGSTAGTTLKVPAGSTFQLIGVEKSNHGKLFDGKSMLVGVSFSLSAGWNYEGDRVSRSLESGDEILVIIRVPVEELVSLGLVIRK